MSAAGEWCDQTQAASARRKRPGSPRRVRHRQYGSRDGGSDHRHRVAAVSASRGDGGAGRNTDRCGLRHDRPIACDRDVAGGIDDESGGGVLQLDGPVPKSVESTVPKSGTGCCSRVPRSRTRRHASLRASRWATTLSWGSSCPAVTLASRWCPKGRQLWEASGALGKVGTAYHAQLVTSGGLSPIHWTVASGALPKGCTLNPLTGVISRKTDYQRQLRTRRPRGRTPRSRRKRRRSRCRSTSHSEPA